MSFAPRRSAVSIRPRCAAWTGIAALAAAVLIPGTAPLLAQPIAAEILPAAALPTTAGATASAIGAGLFPALFADARVTDDGIDDAARPDPLVRAADVAGEDLVCLAKAVRHEAGGQARDGQLAVAQLIVNRLRSGRFAGTICGVVNQQGQFFRTADYNPDRASAAWAAAVAVAQEAVAGASPSVAPGALFFHAAYQPPTGFFRGRQRVAMLGGNVFYR